jgi:hypothetical protein
MITSRFIRFATTSVAAAAIGLGALATAATASAETYQSGAIGGPNGGHAILDWHGVQPDCPQSSAAEPCRSLLSY